MAEKPIEKETEMFYKPEAQVGLVRVLVSNSTGTGFAEWMMLPLGTTLESLLGDVLDEDQDVSTLKIRLNRELAVASYVLQDEDKLSLSPSRVKGA
ncbi:MAG: hypothetical protein DRI98_12335 [Bacteroidetes bacterium]|nr:MAG: hypothetical protein DRI98_12335 [Bacteroidota bacterium]